MKKEVVDAVYIHIPFCNYICAYCDFCKVFYNQKWPNKYLEALEKEINDIYQGEVITSLYIGGGTPSSLSIDELNKLFSILKALKIDNNCEITFEANPDSLTKDKINLLKEFGVNRVSLGVETINKKLQNTLARKTDKQKVIECINNLKDVSINNINVDLIYAIKDETVEDLKEDLNFLISLNVPHISTYSLIIEDNTKLKLNNIKNIDKTFDREMYDIISETLKDNGYIHYEISNFAKPNYESAHNLKYWKNLHYYGFGVGARSYINDIRYTNTRLITKYIEGKRMLEKERLNTNDKMFYEVMLNLRTNKGIDKKLFKKKYKVNIEKIFNYSNLVKENILQEDEDHLLVKEEYFYVLDEILSYFIN